MLLYGTNLNISSKKTEVKLSNFPIIADCGTIGMKGKYECALSAFISFRKIYIYNVNKGFIKSKVLIIQ